MKAYTICDDFYDVPFSAGHASPEAALAHLNKRALKGSEYVFMTMGSLRIDWIYSGPGEYTVINRYRLEAHES